MEKFSPKRIILDNNFKLILEAIYLKQQAKIILLFFIMKPINQKF